MHRPAWSNSLFPQGLQEVLLLDAHAERAERTHQLNPQACWQKKELSLPKPGTGPSLALKTLCAKPSPSQTSTREQFLGEQTFK